MAFGTFAPNALKQGFSGIEFVGIFSTPLGAKFAVECVLEQGLAIDLELGLGGFQAFDALIQLGEQLFDFGDDP